MKRATYFLLAAAVFCLIIVSIGLRYVWLPDIWSTHEKLISETSTRDGYHFAVKQVWNHVDFYSTFLEIKTPDGVTTSYLIDGDDIKRWNGQFAVNEDSKSVKIALSGDVAGSYSWQSKTFENKYGLQPSR